MGSEWTRATLGEVLGGKGYIRGPFGSALKRGELKAKGVPVYEQQHAISNSREFRYFVDENKYAELIRFTVQENDLIVSCSGTLGKISIIQKEDPKGIISQALLLLRPDVNKIIPKYLYYILTSSEGYYAITSVSSGSVQVNIAKRSIIENIDFKLPPLLEQCAIVHILGSLDDKIELNRQMNDILEAIAQAIFKSWFVNFDPVRAKAEGRDPDLPKEIADLFPDYFEDSEFGEIPKEWEPSTIGADFKLTMGQSPPGETYNENGEGLPFFQGRRDFGFRYPTNRVYCSAPKRLAEHGDALVSVRAPVGAINMAMEKCCVGRGVAGIRHKSGSRSYTYYTMNNFRDSFARFEAEGTVFGAINKQQFEGLKWILAPQELIGIFEDIVFHFDERIEKNTLETSILTAIRDTLLPKLISGELRIPDVGKFIKEAGI